MEKIYTTLPRPMVEEYIPNLPEGIVFEFIDYTDDFVELANRLTGAKYILTSPMDYFPKELIDELPELKLIQSFGVGYDKISLDSNRNEDIFVCNNQGMNSHGVAEHIILLALASLKNLVELDKRIKSGGFKEAYEEYLISGHLELGSRTIGIIGWGGIGRELGRLLRPFGSKILYNDILGPDKTLDEDLDITFATKDEIYENANIIAYTVPATEDTIGMINKDAIDKMRENVILINVSRGDIVNNEDLRDALNSERLYAALDVVAPEPPESDHPLLNLNEKGQKRLIMTPHMAGTTTESFKRAGMRALNNFQRVIKGEIPENIVNKK